MGQGDSVDDGCDGAHAGEEDSGRGGGHHSVGIEAPKVGVAARRKSGLDNEDRDRHRVVADVHPGFRAHERRRAVVARIKIWAENKAAMMNGPVPMEVGEVQWEEYTDELEDVKVQAGLGRETTTRARARAAGASAGTAGRSDTRRTSALRRGLRTRSRRRPWRRRMLGACGWSGTLRWRP